MSDKSDTARQVLVVDDSVEIQDTLKVFLEEHGCNVLTASSGSEALSLARTHEFDVVLLDIVMPEMDGKEVLIILKRLFPSLPVIMITGVDDEQIGIDCMHAGAYDYIKKPFDIDYLQTSVLSTMLFG